MKVIGIEYLSSWDVLPVVIQDIILFAIVMTTVFAIISAACIGMVREENVSTCGLKIAFVLLAGAAIVLTVLCEIMANSKTKYIKSVEAQISSDYTWTTDQVYWWDIDSQKGNTYILVPREGEKVKSFE